MGSDINGFLDVKKQGKWVRVADLRKIAPERAPGIWQALIAHRNGTGWPQDVKNSFPISSFRAGEEPTWILYNELKKIDLENEIKKLPESWAAVFKKMEELAQDYGDANVRIVFWFS